MFRCTETIPEMLGTYSISFSWWLFFHCKMRKKPAFFKWYRYTTFLITCWKQKQENTKSKIYFLTQNCQGTNVLHMCLWKRLYQFFHSETEIKLLPISVFGALLLMPLWYYKKQRGSLACECLCEKNIYVFDISKLMKAKYFLLHNTKANVWNCLPVQLHQSINVIAVAMFKWNIILVCYFFFRVFHLPIDIISDLPYCQVEYAFTTIAFICLWYETINSLTQYFWCLKKLWL